MLGLSSFEVVPVSVRAAPFLRAARGSRLFVSEAQVSAGAPHLAMTASGKSLHSIRSCRAANGTGPGKVRDSHPPSKSFPIGISVLVLIYND